MFRRILATLGVALLLATPARAQIVVIVNEANPMTTLSKAEVKAFFLKSTAVWRGGEKVRPIDLQNDGTERQLFLKQVLGLSAGEVERYWIERQYASADSPPAKAPDGETVIKLVKALKGGIGFVSQAAFDASDKAGVRVVFTIAP